MSLSYPNGIEDIPYASYLKINKYEYNEALEKVAKNQNDALNSLASNNNLSRLVDAAGLFMEEFQRSGDPTVDKSNQSGNDERRRELTEQRNKAHIAVEDPVTIPNILTAPDGTEINLEALKKDKEFQNNARKKGLMSATCNLPMPNEFQYQYSADWNNQFKLGTLALLATNPAQFLLNTGLGMAGGTIPSIINGQLGKMKGIKNFNKNNPNAASNIAGGIMTGGKFGADTFGVTSNLNMKNIAGLAGLAPNENAIQMFQRMDMRTFEFTFELAARDEEESEKIVRIIEWFKRGMHPYSKNGRGNATLLQFPDVWVLEPQFVKVNKNTGSTKSIQHPMMPKTKLCALTNVTVNTTPLGQLQTIFDGNIPLVLLSLKFMETTALTRNDMEGSGQDKTNSRFFRSPELDNYPTVTF